MSEDECEDECTHVDGCGCGDNWNQMRRDAYQNGKDIGRRRGANEERAAVVAYLYAKAKEYSGQSDEDALREIVLNKAARVIDERGHKP